MTVTSNERSVIVNADDFGRSHGINRGVVAAHEHGIVTSTSLMVCWPASRDAAWYARDLPRLDIGLHLDLAEWVYESGKWRPCYERVDLSDAQAVRDEAWWQIDRFDLLVGSLPSHIDSHQHVHLSEPARSVVLDIGTELGTVVRGEHPAIAHRGDFYGQSGTGVPNPGALGPEALIRLIDSLGSGITEIGCHPAEGDESGSVYSHERDVERQTLCDLSVREELDRRGIILTSFREVGVPVGT